MIARAATLADVTELVRIINLAYLVEAEMFHGDRTSDADLRDRLARPNAAILTIDDVGGPAGRLAGSVYVERRDDRGYFGMLAVDPSQQGRGLGRALVRAAEEYAREFGCAVMELDVVHLRSELTTFYGSLGYTAVGEVPYPHAEATKVPIRLIQMTRSLGVLGNSTAIARDGEEVLIHVDGQDWLSSWHPAERAPLGQSHGAAGICVTEDGEVVLISHDGHRWDIPAGRPEGDETWEQTLRREVREEACATVRDARLLGFYRSACVAGREAGLVLFRSFWRAEVTVEPWVPQFEIIARRLVSPAELLAHLPAPYLPLLRRALVEAAVLSPALASEDVGRTRSMRNHQHPM